MLPLEKKKKKIDVFSIRKSFDMFYYYILNVTT